MWYFSIYIPGAKKRLRGSCGTCNRDEAQIIEQTMRLGATRESPRDRLIRIIDALFPEEPARIDDVPLNAINFDLLRTDELAGRSTSQHNADLRRQRLRSFAKWTRENCPSVKTLRGVDRRCAQGYAAWLMRKGKKAKSIRNHIGTLSAIWNVLKRSHDNLDNPWPLAMPAPQRQNVRDAFTPEEVLRLFAAADGVSRDWGLACRIAAATGLRMGDTITLRHGDVRGNVIDTVPNKTKSYGVRVRIPLPPSLLARIGNGNPDEYLMPSLATHYNGHKFYGVVQFADIMAAANVPPNGRTFHSFRHFFRTQLSRAGVSDEIAMRLGGWTQRSTADRYDHDGRSREKADAIAAAWALTEK